VHEKRVSYGILEGLLIFSILTSHNLHLSIWGILFSFFILIRFEIMQVLFHASYHGGVLYLFNIYAHGEALKGVLSPNFRPFSFELNKNRFLK